MKLGLHKIKTILLFPILFLKFIYYWNKIDKVKLPGKEFASYGIRAGFKLLLKLRVSPKLIFNPVSIVRYFEFEYSLNNLQIDKNNMILDVSSPYLFGFYVSEKYNCSYKYINPDINDLNNVKSLATKLNFQSEYVTECLDAKSLPKYPQNYFDIVVSISVIEHIANDGDSVVIKEMWRVLKPGGKLILTFPVKKNFEEEFSDDDVYHLQYSETKEKYFFQRIYDEENINKRLLSSLDKYQLLNQSIFGEITGSFYAEYKKRWLKHGLYETVKDPYYITKHFKHFRNISDLPGVGVLGLTIKKLQ